MKARLGTCTGLQLDHEPLVPELRHLLLSSAASAFGYYDSYPYLTHDLCLCCGQRHLRNTHRGLLYQATPRTGNVLINRNELVTEPVYRCVDLLRVNLYEKSRSGMTSFVEVMPVDPVPHIGYQNREECISSLKSHMYIVHHRSVS